MAACRGARIEWFSDCSNHGGAFFTPAGFRSQAPCQHFTRDITLGTRITEAYPPILSITWLGIPGGPCARVPQAVPSIASTQTSAVAPRVIDTLPVEPLCHTMRAPNRQALTRRCPMRLKKEHLDADWFRGHQ